MTLALGAIWACGAQASAGVWQEGKIPPIAQLVGDIQGPGVATHDLAARIEAAFDRNIDHDWFSKPGDELAATGATDTVHLVRVLRDQIESAPASQLPVYRHIWRVLCHRILILRVPRPPDTHLTEHLDYPTAVQENSFMGLVTLLLESTEDLWLRLDLGSASSLDDLRMGISEARELRDVGAMAIDHTRMGDVADAYRKFRTLDDKMTAVLGLPPHNPIVDGGG